MSWMIGTVKCQCRAIMGMPWDTSECQTCGKKKAFSPFTGGLTGLRKWAIAHSDEHVEGGE